MNIDEEIRQDQDNIVKLKQQKIELERRKKLLVDDYCWKEDNAYHRIITLFDNRKDDEYGRRFLVEKISFGKETPYYRSDSIISSCLTLEWSQEVSYEKWMIKGEQIDIKDFYLIKLQILEALKEQSGGNFKINLVPKTQVVILQNNAGVSG
ncbi:MAG: hypothetical protein AABW67_00575 [Nanoarchaeota archaeon]